MKRTLLAAALTAAALCSCTKEGVKLFEGYYSYKLSGEITLTEIVEQTDDTAEPTEPEVLTLTLNPESGQMNILTRDKNEGTMVVTMNALGGGVTTFEAKVADGRLKLPGGGKQLGSGAMEFKLTLSGEGSRLGDVVLMDLVAAETEIERLGKSYKLTDSKITCVASSNDR